MSSYRISAELASAIAGELFDASFHASAPDADLQIERAEVLVAINQVIYDHIKTWYPGGEGIDGSDGPERAAVGKVLDAAKFYLDDLVRQLGDLT